MRLQILLGTVVTVAPRVPGDEPYTHAQAKAKIIAEVQQAIHAGAFGAANATTNSAVDLVAFAYHSSILWRQGARTLRSGLVQDFYKLQGRKSIWFTGGLWAEDYSGNMWAFTDTVIPRILASLGRSAA